MDHHPGKPGHKPLQLQPEHNGDGVIPSDRRHIAQVLVLEGGFGLTLQSPCNVPRRPFPLLYRHLSDSRILLAIRSVQRSQVPGHIDLVVSCQRQIRLNHNTTRPVCLNPKRPSQPGRLNPGSPQYGGRCDLLARGQGDSRRVDIGNHRIQPDIDTEVFEILLCPGGQLLREGKENAWRGLDKQDLRLGRINGIEVPRDAVPGDFRDRSSQFNPGWASSNNGKRKVFAPLVVRLGPFRCLERQQNLIADSDRVIQILETAGIRFPFVMTEVRMRRPRALRSGSRMKTILHQ